MTQHRYTPSQVSQYLDHIGYPATSHASDALQKLRDLTVRQICRVPFECLSLHYSPYKRLSLDPDALFDKVVVRSKGGYCMELNALFGQMLRSLGYTVLNVGGRVAGPNGYTGWSHMVNLVTVDGTRYVVDVGFGSHQAMKPVPLRDGYEFTQISPRRGRLEYRSVGAHSDQAQRVWVYSTQETASAPWVEANMFTETEFFRADYEGMNLSPMSSPSSFFVKTVMAVRGILDEDAGQVGGVYVLFGARVKMVRKDEPEQILHDMVTEKERVAAIDKYFLVPLAADEQRGILGLPTQLKID